MSYRHWRRPPSAKARIAALSTYAYYPKVLDSFTLFAELAPEIRRSIWDAAVENAHDGPQVLHVRMHGINTNEQGQRLAEIEHTSETVTETQDSRNLALACYEARHAVRKRLPKTLPLCRGQLWFSEEDVVTFVYETNTGFGLFKTKFHSTHLTMMFWALCRIPSVAQELQIGRVGIDMTALCRYAADCIRSSREIRSCGGTKARDPWYGTNDFLGDSHALPFLLQLLFPGSDVYAVWNNQKVKGFYRNIKAKRLQITKARREFLDTFPREAAPMRPAIDRRLGPECGDRFSGFVSGLLSLKVGHVLYSNSKDISSGTGILEMDAPQPFVS